MTAKLEVTITENDGQMKLKVEDSGNRTSREEALLAEMFEMVKVVSGGLSGATPGCNCPVCSLKREVRKK